MQLEESFHFNYVTVVEMIVTCKLRALTALVTSPQTNLKSCGLEVA